MFQYETLTFHCFGINVPTLVRYTVRKCKLKNIFFPLSEEISVYVPNSDTRHKMLYVVPSHIQFEDL